MVYYNLSQPIQVQNGDALGIYQPILLGRDFFLTLSNKLLQPSIYMARINFLCVGTQWCGNNQAQYISTIHPLFFWATSINLWYYYYIIFEKELTTTQINHLSDNTYMCIETTDTELSINLINSTKCNVESNQHLNILGGTL